MIFPARVYHSDGTLKAEMSANELSKSYWSRFQDEEKKRRKQSLKFGTKTALQQYIAMERMVDEFANTKPEYPET